MIFFFIQNRKEWTQFFLPLYQTNANPHAAVAAFGKLGILIFCFKLFKVTDHTWCTAGCIGENWTPIGS